MRIGCIVSLDGGQDSREVHRHVSRKEGLSDAKPVELHKEVKKGRSGKGSSPCAVGTVCK